MNTTTWLNFGAELTKIGKKLCLKIVGPNSIFFLCVISHCKNMLDYGFSISSPSSFREPKSTFKPAVDIFFIYLNISIIWQYTTLKESLVISRRLREFFLKLSQYKAFIDKGVSKFGIFLKSGIFNTSKNLQMTPLLLIFVDI